MPIIGITIIRDKQKFERFCQSLYFSLLNVKRVTKSLNKMCIFLCFYSLQDRKRVCLCTNKHKSLLLFIYILLFHILFVWGADHRLCCCFLWEMLAVSIYSCNHCPIVEVIFLRFADFVVWAIHLLTHGTFYAVAITCSTVYYSKPWRACWNCTYT